MHSNSWQNSEVEQRQHALRLAPVLTRTEMLNHGSVDLPEAQHLGDRGTRNVINTMVVKAVVEVVARAVLLLGPVIAVNGITTIKAPITITVGSRTMATEALLHPGLHLGTKPQLLERKRNMEATLVATLDTQPWALPLALVHLLPRRLIT